MKKQLKPIAEKQVKEGFYEIRKKLGEIDEPDKGQRVQRRDKEEREYQAKAESKDDGEVQVYVSHICLHNYHPIFCKFDLQTVKIILHYSSIMYLSKGQTLYAPGLNDSLLYIVLYGRCKLYNNETIQQWGQTLNIGWTIGEEILFGDHAHTKEDQRHSGQKKRHYTRKEICKASSDGCVLALEKKNLKQIKKYLRERGGQEEFSKLEIVLRGNHLVKKGWK